MTKAQMGGWLAFIAMVTQRYPSAALKHEERRQVEWLKENEWFKELLRDPGIEDPSINSDDLDK